MADLKPCPFCGGKATIFRIPENTEEENNQHPGWRWRNPGMYAVGCTERPLCFGYLGHMTMTFISAEGAVEAWNQRAEKGEKDGDM